MNSDENAILNATARNDVYELYSKFAEAVKDNQTPNEVIEKDEFSEIRSLLLECYKKCQKELSIEEVYYRARIYDEKCKDEAVQLGKHDGFDKLGPNSFGIPPKPEPGRINSPDFRCLYLANSEECALYEVRPSIDENVVVAEGYLTKSIACISLLDIPFMNPPTDNIGCMIQLLDRMFSLPIRDPKKNYKPTQMIALHIASLGYDGIIYSSSQLKYPKQAQNIYDDPYNLALFDKSKSKWIAIRATFYKVFDKSYRFSRDPITRILDALQM